MKLSDHILGKKWCEMLFEDRNKEYGAYSLRQQTGRRYAKAMGCLGGMLLMLVGPIVLIMIIFATPPQTYDIADQITRFEGVRIKEARPQRRPEKKSEPEMSEKAEPQIEDVDPVADMLTVKLCCLAKSISMGRSRFSCLNGFSSIAGMISELT